MLKKNKYETPEVSVLLINNDIITESTDLEDDDIFIDVTNTQQFVE